MTTTTEIPSPEAEQRLSQALIMKASRLMMLAEAPLGSWGEVTEFGQAQVRPDYQIREVLFGLHLLDVTTEDLAGLITPEDVIRAGMQLDPATFPTARIPDVQRAIDAAADWIFRDLTQSWGIA